LTRTIRKRTGEAKREVLVLTEQTGELLRASITRRADSSRPPVAAPAVVVRGPS
jgi:hypothetical protein